MAMYKVVLCVWIFSFALMHCNCQTITMTPAVADVIEGSDVTLVCKVYAVLQHVFTTWTLNTSSLTPIMIYQNGTCVGLNLGDKDKYSISCNSTVFMLTVNKVDRSQHNSMWTCIAAGQSNGPNSVIKVKVPITSVAITPYTSTVIEENNSKPFICNTSKGRPAGAVLWYKLHYGVQSQINQNTTETQNTNADGFIETTSVLRYVPTREQNGIKIYCEAGNTANINKVKSSETLLDVQYPPKVGNLSVMDIVEGTPLNKMCPFTPGNPPKTTVKWTRNIDAWTWNQEVLTIQSVTRSDDANYTCEIYNVVSTEVEETGTFHLNVQYKAVVTSFYVLGFETNTGVTTVNESHTLQLSCTVKSNPLPTIQIRKGDNTLNSSTGKMNVLYPIGNAKCLDAGTYTCLGINKVNEGVKASKQLQVNVNCSPRHADTVNLNRTSGTNETFTFTFNAIAHPVPVFIWKKWTGDVWKHMQNDDNVQITSIGLQSNLTIHRVGYGDFGKYLLLATNDFGRKEFHYQLELNDKPDVPTDLRHIERLTTESSIQLEWKPGYDGGPPQTFYITYKKSSSSTWNFVSVPDNGEQTMQYMLNGLVSDTQYQLIIYSSNRKGNSSLSEILIAKTKGKMKSNPAPTIGGVVGGLVMFAVIGVEIVFIVRRYKIRKGLPSSDAKKETTRNENETNKPSEDADYYNIGREVQVASQSNNEATYYNEDGIPDYEMLNQQNRDFTTYSSLQPNSSSLTNDNSSDEKKTYENLQLGVI